MDTTPLIFCAIDTADLDHAVSLAAQIGPVTGGVKLGLEFVNSFGPHGIEAVQKACPEAALFIDLKFHDIPTTVAGAVRTLSQRFAPAYMNVHASGGIEMMRAAKDACGPETKMLGVTILSSLSKIELSDIGYEGDEAAESVRRLALLTQQAGLAGVVCSGHEIEVLRQVCESDFALMVPGIRPEGTDVDDQKRVMTPNEAVQLGATHLVIGRPITNAEDPAQMAADILESL